ncbi:MAG: alpha/beta hydrolase, partial [Comamonas sp.]
LEITPAAVPRIEELRIPARDGALLPARLYAGSGQSAQPALLYLHGGGFTIGSIATHDVLCRELAHLSGAAVVSLDYRLAPEHRFPVASNDSWDALAWLAAHAGELRLDPARLAVGGDSAGGTLAAACAVMARDAGLKLALQLLFYPGTTAHQDTPSHTKFADGPILDKASIDWFFGNYIAPGQREDWRFAPLLAPDVEGVAPAWIGLAEFDPLVDEGIAWADRLRMAGVAVDLDIYRGVTHEFIKMGRALPEARQAHRDAARALRAALELE